MGNESKPNYVSIPKSPKPVIKHPKNNSSSNYNPNKPTRETNKPYGLLEFPTSVNDLRENRNDKSKSDYISSRPKKNENTPSKKNPYKGLKFSTSVDDIQMTSNHFNTKKNKNPNANNKHTRVELRYSYSVNDIQENPTQNQYGKSSFSSINDADYFNYSPREIEIPSGKTGYSYEKMQPSTLVNDIHVPSENSSYGKARFSSTNGKIGDSYEEMQASASVNKIHEGRCSNTNNKDYYGYCPPSVEEKEKKKSIPSRKISNPCYGVLNFTKEDKTTANDSKENCSEHTEKNVINIEVTIADALNERNGLDDKVEIQEDENGNATSTAVDHTDATTTAERKRSNHRKRQSRYSTSSCYDNHRQVLTYSLYTV